MGRIINCGQVTENIMISPKQFLKSRILEEKLGKGRNIGQFLPKSRKSRNVQKSRKK